MNDLERELRTALDREAGAAPAPHAAGAAVRRTRRRQVGTVALGALAVVAIAGAAFAGVRAIGDGSGEVVPASTTDTMNGITITYPETWTLIDPDAAGLNGPSPTPDVPRLVMALAPFDPGELLACPGMSETPHAFLMTIQEQPLALGGDGARPWPVELEPMEVGTAESACYPGWDFSQATWTAADRSFDARVGFAPDVSDADRDALLEAFASMSFAPLVDRPTSVVLATGVAAGEEWTLTATNDGDDLVLGLDGEGFGSGVGGFDPRAEELHLSSHVFGSGRDAERVIFGAAPSDAVQIGLRVVEDDELLVDVLDVPDTIDSRFDAFVVSVFARYDAVINAYDADGNIIASGTIGRDESIDPQPPTEAPLEDGRHFGFVRAVDVEARTVEFDLAYFLTGEEANEAYQEATGETGPVPNDYYVVNENPRLRTLSLSPELRLRLLDWTECCDRFFEGDLEPFARAIEERSDFLVHGENDVIYRGVSSWWITVENGVVVEIEEQYTP